ncbi:Frizzled-4 [Caenorhabditis elegans]|uniref:Frizzled-4 n=1 Tax=Caenorhabditis elegans TaxID=6239 RepID=G5EF44_CAEEL|nr:Frizzled-4 [Caenorhabditis elegans]AAC46993.1 transmembrane receptor [Caenorhabditis elegans]CCD71747.1 Frizzled-4 [Caenorhabditis elegans]|eukprot:NP_490796.2 Uncharacterized protein CELE_Y34D9B.1 [Caenorhabditis elegans]
MGPFRGYLGVTWLLLLFVIGVDGQRCQKVDHEMCNDLPYNLTSFPNLVDEESWKDASESILTYKPLLSVVCSEQLKFFLCSVYFPMCNEKLANPIGPCRPLCLSVQEKCLPVLESFGFKWPDVIRCDKFPLENNREKMCMKGPNEQGAIQDERAKFAAKESEDDGNDRVEDIQREVDRLNGKCPQDEVFLNRSSKCVPLCSNPQKVGQTDRESATRLLLFLSLSSVILTILSVFIVGLSRLEMLHSLTETAMFFSCISFCATSVIYIVSISFKDQFQISCTDYTHHLLFVVGGLSHVPCSSVASLIYYTATCSRLWWLLICVSWNKATRTSHILDDSRTRVIMLILGIPLAPLMLALLAKAVAANPLTGLCFIGAASPGTDWIFNFCRELILFLISSIALSSACCRLLGSDEQDVNGFAGVIAAVYPIAGLFYMLSFVNDATQPFLSLDRSFNAVSATKFSFDLLLSFIMCAFCLIYLLFKLTRSSSKVSKEGYQPAVPKLPQPAIPGSVRSNTYASTFRTNNMI